MLTKFLANETNVPVALKEGDLYKEFTIGGRTFRLFYGYYEEFEREYNEPIVIYPDFIQNPVFTDEGVPIVTAMQDVCEHYAGKQGGDGCADCIYFRTSEELFGLCGCVKRRKRSN